MPLRDGQAPRKVSPLLSPRGAAGGSAWGFPAETACGRGKDGGQTAKHTDRKNRQRARASTGVTVVHGWQRGHTTKGGLTLGPSGHPAPDAGSERPPVVLAVPSTPGWAPHFCPTLDPSELSQLPLVPQAFISPHKTHRALGVHPSLRPSQELSWNPRLWLSVQPQPPAPPTHNQHLTSTSVAVLTASQPCGLRSKRGLRPPHWCVGMTRIQEKRECQLHDSPAGSKDATGIHLRSLPPELPSCRRVLWSLPPGVTQVTTV